MQKGGAIESGVDPSDVDDVAARKRWWILYGEAIDPNGKWKEGEIEALDFDLLSRFLLEVGDYLGAIAIYFDESGYGKKYCDQEYGGYNENSSRAAGGHD
jgi:hypothetical protein